MYTWRGTIWDGEGLAGIHRYLNFILELYMFFFNFLKNFYTFFTGKGVGRIQIEHPANLTAGQPSNMTIDLFVTHTIADSGTTKANDTWYRYKLTTYLLFF